MRTKKPFISTDELMSITHHVVRRYVAKKAIPTRDIKDVEMSIIEKFLLQENKIAKAFKGDSKIKTYCIAIVNRMCCEIIRKDFKHWQQVQNEETATIEFGTTGYTDSDKNAIINSEIQRLSRILKFFNKEQDKLIIAYQFIHELPINSEAIERYAKDQGNEIKQLYEKNNTALAEKYNMLANFINKIEEKNVKGDAIRMWLNKNIDSILRRLNGNGVSYYDKKTLQTLFELAGQIKEA